MQPYKEGLREKWGVKKFNLDDLYVRFFRISERRIADGTGKGIICFISNYSWLSGASYVVMRQRLTERFDRIWIENMHGDRNITEYGPDGRSSETVFAIAGFSPGIRQGVATAMLVRTGKKQPPIYRFRDDINPSKAADRRAALLATLAEKNFDAGYETLHPTPENRFSLRPGAAAADYAAWPDVRSLAAQAPFNGPVERRGLALIDDDKEKLASRIRAYFDLSISDAQIARICPPMMMVGNEINGPLDRLKICQIMSFAEEKIIRLMWKPFDIRWCYWDNIAPLYSRPNPELMKNTKISDNFYFISRDDADTPDEGPPAWITSNICDYDLLRGHARLFPVEVFRREESGPTAVGRQADMFSAEDGTIIPNLSQDASIYLERIGLGANRDGAALVWRHAAAIIFSPAYLAENAAGLRQGFPRIPLPENADLLKKSAALGEQLAALLDPDNPVDGVTAGEIRPELAAIAVPVGQNFALTAGWGNRTEKGITMPGRGKSEPRAYAETEAATAAHATILGEKTRDVFLNETSFWKNIPEAVWETHIGGYQVLKKWLSYREKPIIGRDLTDGEIRHVMETARRLAAILLLGPDLDASFRACAKSPDPTPPCHPN